MSKFIFVKYKKDQNSEMIINNISAVLNAISPDDLSMKNSILKSNICENSFWGVQNCNNEIDEAYLLFGHVTSGMDTFENVDDPLPDGSYSLIRFNNSIIEFFCDKFNSKTLWYSFDEEKLIISNSQRAIVAFKQQFKYNLKTVSWFLSSGSQGPFISWDKDIHMVNSELIRLNVKEWEINKLAAKYVYEYNQESQKYKSYNKLFFESISNILRNVFDKIDINKTLIPLSGGYDSRLILNVLIKEKIVTKVNTINWGIIEGTKFDDKQASRKIADYYKLNHKDACLPESVEDFLILFKNYVRVGDCRIDHFNAYTDNFKLWKDLYKDGYRELIRGDVPYPTGVEMNSAMYRVRAGLSMFKDFSNCCDYSIDKFISEQEIDPRINRRRGESLIQWRDRIYTEYRIPIVVSAFGSIINGFVEDKLPIMNGELFLYYSKLRDNKKGNKKHIIKTCKKLDQTGVKFGVESSLLSTIDYFNNSKGINFLKEYLSKYADRRVFDVEFLESVNSKLHINNNTSKGVIYSMQKKLSKKIPSYIKAYLKSRNNLCLNPIVLAFRIVLSDIAIKMFKEDAKMFS